MSSLTRSSIEVPTFLVAGHETTRYGTTFSRGIFGLDDGANSAAAIWALYAMTNAPEIQTELREELFSVDTETPTMDELMALPYLDAVVRETLRVHSPVPSTERIAMKDDVLPVEKPYRDKNGVVHNSIRYDYMSPIVNSMGILILPNSIRKGDPIFISILAINRSQELWGPDAHEFKYVVVRLVIYLVRSHVAFPTVDQNGGKTFRRQSPSFQACGDTY